MAVRVVSYRRVEWTNDSFGPYKSPGMGGTLLALLQQGQRILVPYLVKIFHACLGSGYVPAIWSQVKVVYLNSVGIPRVDLGILDLSVSHHS